MEIFINEKEVYTIVLILDKTYFKQKQTVKNKVRH